MDEPTPAPPLSQRTRQLLPASPRVYRRIRRWMHVRRAVRPLRRPSHRQLRRRRRRPRRRTPLEAHRPVRHPRLHSRRGRRERAVDDFAPSGTACVPGSVRPGRRSARRDACDGLARARHRKLGSARGIDRRTVRPVRDGRAERIRGAARKGRSVHECHDHEYRKSRDRRGASPDGRVARKIPSAASRSPEAEQARRRLAKTAPVVLAFLAGTVSGTLAWRAFGFVCLALPLALLSTLAALAALRRFDDE